MILTEDIEMDLFAVIGTFAVPIAVIPQNQQETMSKQPEHPLVPLPLEEEDMEQPKQQRETVTPAKIEKEYIPRITNNSFESIEIEMEVFPPSGLTESDVVEITPDDPSVMSRTPEPVVLVSPEPIRPSKLKWRRITPGKTGLVVKDVICLPQGHYLAQEDRHSVPRGQERDELAAMGLIARITIDNSWLPHEMESRLASLFKSRFFSGREQRFTFTYLQCLEGSRVLFVPDTPPQFSWSGEQVLQIAGHGPLYILSHYDFMSFEIQCEWPTNSAPVINSHDFLVDDNEDDDDDEERSVESPLPVTADEEVISDLVTILRTYREQNSMPDIQTHMYVRRRDIFRSALKVMGKKSFSIKTTPLFHFLGEEVDDYDGPLREFFRLIMLELQESGILEGRPGHLLFAYDQAALEERRYYAAGVMVAWSLLHGGPGPCCLHQSLYQLMCGQSPPLEDFSWMDISDVDVQMKLQQAKNCTSIQRLTPNLCEWIAGCGIPDIYSAEIKDMPSIYTLVLRHYIYHRVASMISQFTEGLNSCGGLWDIIKAHSAAFMSVMTRTEHPLTLEQFKSLFEVSWSPLESTIGLRQAEETTVTSWERFLIMVNEHRTALSFGDLLAFITGADQIPPLGFLRNLCIRFYDQGMFSVRLPHASTCTLELHLPRGVASPGGLKDMLTRALQESLGFGNIYADSSALSQLSVQRKTMWEESKLENV
ncbi:uncharacterized protein LOC121540264 [Coregonus clupeaformis]|uniref:uncharacterized protein LOC121540264 n=1 Tax=Coregonus clupeaformis TaxID=59861 RepID=UPI001BE03A9C|nr:uncharacterized protein LOC121540264 [Coregonus clupeaformis]